MNGLVVIGSRWFPNDERMVAGVIANYAYYIGWAVGLIIPPVLLKQDDEV